MTVDALPRDTAKASAAIGAHDANIFLCPRCTRPLAVGVSKCAGCGTRLLAGVPLLKVGGFIGAGLIVGLLVGGGGVGAATLLGRPATGTVGLPPAAVLPSAAPAPASIAPGAVIQPASSKERTSMTSVRAASGGVGVTRISPRDSRPLPPQPVVEFAAPGITRPVWPYFAWSGAELFGDGAWMWFCNASIAGLIAGLRPR